MRRGYDKFNFYRWYCYTAGYGSTDVRLSIDAFGMCPLCKSLKDNPVRRLKTWLPSSMTEHGLVDIYMIGVYRDRVSTAQLFYVRG